MSLCSHCVQGLANESSNHSYGSLGSSSDKESEVKHTLNVSAVNMAMIYLKAEQKTTLNITYLLHWSLVRHSCCCVFFLALPARLSVSPTASTSPSLLFLELWFEKRELPCLLSMYSFFPLFSSCRAPPLQPALLGKAPGTYTLLFSLSLSYFI